MPKADPAKDAPSTSATAVAEPEPSSTPQTREEIAATAAALGVGALPPPVEGKTNAVLAKSAPVRMGVAPANVEEGWRLAQFIASSDLVPKGYKGRPADVLVAIQYGMEVGLPPMAALHSIFVTNGRPSLFGDGFLAVIMASAAYKDHDEYYMVDGKRQEFLVAADLSRDDTMAVVTFWRTDSPRPRTATFSVAKAKKAGLWTKAGPWTEYPDRMLKFRARGFAGHDCFPDVLRGMRTVEEMRDLPPEDEPDAAPIEVRRVSEGKPAPAFDPALDHLHVCRGGHEYACAEKKCAGTRQLDCAEHAPAVAGPNDLNLGPVAVKAVAQFLGGFTITLGDGTQVDTIEIADASELEKFIGTKNKIVAVCTKADDGNLQLKSFRIAD